MKTKKIVSTLAVCALVLTLFSALPALAATNHLTDSIGFEGESYTSASTFDGWNISSTASASICAEVTSEKAYSGSNSLKLTILNGASATQVTYTGGSTLTAGTEYKITMMVCMPTSIAASEGTGGVQIRINNASNGSGGTTTLWPGGAAYHYTGDEWHEISGTFVATDSTNFAFRFRDGAVTNGVFYVDDIAVYSTEELQADAEAEEAERAEKNFSFVSEYRSTDTDELYNDMESTNFNIYGVELAIDTDVKYQGAGALKMQLTADGTGYNSKITSKTLPTFKNGVQYEASVWTNIPDDSSISQIRFLIDLGADTSDIGRYVQRKVVLTSTNGQWVRIAIPFTMTADDAPSSIVLAADGAKDAVIYWDDLTIVRKQSQNAVLQLTKSVTLDGGGTIEADVTSPGAGAFTVKYDFHKASATSAGKVLIAGIYKDTGAGKQLMEIKMVSVGTEDTSVSIPMTGIESPDESYSLKVMYWDSLEGMFGYRTAEYAF